MNRLEGLDLKTIGILNAEQAHTFRVIPTRVNGKEIDLAGDQSSHQYIPELQLLLGKRVLIETIAGEEVDRYLGKYYPGQGTFTHTSKIEVQEESNTVRFVNNVMQEAVRMKASDIHIERYEDLARIRFRWEGQLVEKYEIQLAQYNAIISRVKILSELDIAERRLPQDGRINLEIEGTKIDIRVSTIPGKYGEMVVMRLLTRSKEQLDLDNIGLPEKEKGFYEEHIHAPNGIILITGPTGSGKTTSLYATLNLLNTPVKKILTIEDPIEYNLRGINQVQLKEDIGLTFDRALRAFLRQDPDIIMVGEIRDVDTAQIAIRAALTGHLVFSTLHTNSAWDAVTRLTDMGIEPYLLAASLRMVVAQRLVRVLCEHCKQFSDEVVYMDIQWDLSILEHYVPCGCPKCFHTGYKGRRAVFEILPITPELSQIIKGEKGEVDQILQAKKIPTLKQNLATLITDGIVSLEESIAHLRG